LNAGRRSRTRGDAGKVLRVASEVPALAQRIERSRQTNQDPDQDIGRAGEIPASSWLGNRAPALKRIADQVIEINTLVS
jgi:hypothetical protein